MNRTKVGTFLVIAVFFMFCSISASSAGLNIGSNQITVTNDGDNASNGYAQLGVNGIIYSIEKSKIPKKYKKYENYTFQASKNKKIKYIASVNSQALLSNMSGVKIKDACINFGDGTKTKSNGWITHTYAKSGWYKLTVSFNATFSKVSWGNMTFNGSINGATKEYLIYVTDKPQLALSKLNYGCTNYKDYKKGNINYLDVKVTNVGSTSSKATKIKIWYEKPNKYGTVYPKLKKYTKSANLKALKPGQSTTVRIYFSIPKKYSKIWKDIRLDSLYRVNQINRASALYRFR